MVTTTATIGLQHCWRCATPTVDLRSEHTALISSRKHGLMRVEFSKVTVRCGACNAENVYAYSGTVDKV